MNMDEKEFKVHCQRYCHILACKYIADDCNYFKYLQKQALLKNETAIKSMTALDTMMRVQRDIKQMIQDLSALGYKSVVDACNAIQTQESLPFLEVNGWATCALSGVNSNRLLRLNASDASSILIDDIYKPFACMLWLATHIQDVEYNRVQEFIKTIDASFSIKEMIQAHDQHVHDTLDDSIHEYFLAFDATFHVLKNTLTHGVTES